MPSVGTSYVIVELIGMNGNSPVLYTGYIYMYGYYIFFHKINN